MTYSVKVTFKDETTRIFLDVSGETYSLKYYIFTSQRMPCTFIKSSIDYVEHIGKTGKDAFIYSDIIYDGGRQRIIR